MDVAVGLEGVIVDPAQRRPGARGARDHVLTSGPHEQDAERREDDDESADGDEQHGQDASGVVHPSAVVLHLHLAHLRDDLHGGVALLDCSEAATCSGEY